LTAKTAEIV